MVHCVVIIHAYLQKMMKRSTFREMVTRTSAARADITSRRGLRRPDECLSTCVSTEAELLDALAALGVPPEGEILLCPSTQADPLILTQLIALATDPDSDFPDSDFFNVEIGTVVVVFVHYIDESVFCLYAHLFAST